MTLAEWTQKYHDSIDHVEQIDRNQPVSSYLVYDRATPNQTWELFHLDDYAVSSVISGGGKVLVPRGTANAEM